MEQIALIIPSQKEVTKSVEVPLGLLYISATLKNNGYTPIIYDLTLRKNQMSDSELIKELKNKKIRFIGMSFGTDNRFYAFDLCKKIKKAIPDAILIAGGWHVSAASEDTIEHIKEIDYVVLNEGEATILELMNTLMQNKDPQHIKGIVMRDNKTNKIINNGKREFISDLDTIPYPARELINLKEYNQTLPFNKQNIQSVSIITSRGCPYRCIYCSTAKHWGHMVRYRSIKNVIDEIKLIKKTYGSIGIEIRDDTFTLNKSRVLQFCDELIKQKLNIQWWCETRANTIDEEMVIKMKQAGCYYMAMAIESANPKTLKIIKKAITIEQGINAVKIIRKHGILLKVFFMFGLPEERKKETEITAFMLRDMEHKYGIYPVYGGVTLIYPGTELETIAKEKKIMAQNFTWTKKIHNPLSKYNLAFPEQTPLYLEIKYETLAKMIKQSFLKYYLHHPIYFVKALWKYRKEAWKWII
jgi:anaerobic magnesium-protoporphyrin IX monomethyl ester cyclase